MDVIEISALGLAASFLLLLIPLAMSHYYDLRLIKTTLLSIARMSIQLFIVGVFLEYIFALNNAWLNSAWLIMMIATAIATSVSNTKIKMKTILIPITLAFSLPTILILLYFNRLIIRLDFLFEARYLIALGGMLLGNVLSVNIVAINAFYQEIRSQNKWYLYRLAMGATQKEALTPFFRNAFQLSLLPSLAKTATIGIVSLPGMMSGQILGGSSPATAIRYQIAIMIAIYVVGAISVLLSLTLTTKNCFNNFNILKSNIFK